MKSNPRNSYMYFCAVMAILLQLTMTYIPFVRFPTYLIEYNSSTQLILLSQGYILKSIIIYIDPSIPSWVHVLPIFLCDKKTMSIKIYLPTLHYIKLLGLSRCTKVTWHTLQHQTCERYTQFIKYLQQKNCDIQWLFIIIKIYSPTS